MKKVKILFSTVVLSIFLLNGCSSLNVGDGLMSILTSQLGVTDTQALGGAGALLQLAQDKLGVDQFSAISAIIPGADSYLNIANTVGKISGSLTSLDDVKPIFENLGMSGDLVGDFIPAISGYASMAGGSDVADLLFIDETIIY